MKTAAAAFSSQESGPSGPSASEPASEAASKATPEAHFLAAHHAAMLEACAIDPAVRAERGYRTVTARADLLRLGFSDRQARVPALLLPVHGVTGEIVSYQARPDVPRVGRDGKSVRYETPGKSRMVLDIPPRARAALRDPTKPLVITEGLKKADSAASKGLCCVGMLGVWNFRGMNELGGRTSLAEWESIALNDRQVYIVFDSDVATKPAVKAALLRLKAFLESRGAKVAIVYLKPGEGGTKVGMDDFFAAGNDVAALLRLAETEVRTGDEDAKPRTAYSFEDDGIYLHVETDDGTRPVRLTNFTAQIVNETTLDDGEEERKSFRIEASLGKRRVEFEIPAQEFEDLRWPTSHVGAGATLFPVANVERHVRAAIQTDSGVTAARQRVYVHTGWIRHGEKNVFLHAGGAIGEEGPVEGLKVRLDARLAGFVLPPPAEKGVLARCLTSVLAFLALGPARITVPLFAAVWRVLIAECDLSIHLTGGSGVFKTALAAVVQQFFGKDMDARHLPGSWSSTANALEALAFYAKDVLLVVDDFAPSGGAGSAGKLHQAAERVFRSQGNKAGRGRCGPDGTLRATRDPRGLLVSTGEDVPRGASLRARFLTSEVAPGDIDRERLTAAQASASAGDYVQVTASFVKWLAPRLETVRAKLPKRVEELRQVFSREGRHRRVPGLAADLLFGVEVFVESCRDEGLMDEAGAGALLERARAAISEAVGDQEREHDAADPARRFIALLRSAISSGSAYLTTDEGKMPERPEAWGWHVASVEASHDDQKSRWVPQGVHVGWVSGDDAYLDTEAAVKGAQAVGNATGDPISLLPATLAKRLKDAGLLASTDPDGRHIEVRRRLCGGRHRVLHFSAATLVPQDDEAPDVGAPPSPAPSPEASPEAGPPRSVLL